jgi:hypothetical protein
MKDSACPKCGSTEVIHIPGVPNSPEGILTGYTTRSVIPITRRVCNGCGFLEEWVESPDDLKKLREKFGVVKRDE